MIKTFKETIHSLQNPNYGNTIISLSLRKVIWYWTKYLLLIAGISFFIAIFFVTNKLPQLPRFILEKFPEGNISFNNGQLSSTVLQPMVIGSPEFALILDTEASDSALDIYSSGILFQKNQILLKSEDGQTDIQTYERVPDFSIDKQTASETVSKNIIKIWFIIFGAILSLTLIISSITWFWKGLSYLIWALLFLAIAKFIMKKNLDYLQVLKIVIYASVLPFLLSIILSFFPNPILEILNLAVLSYFGFNWISNIQTEQTISPIIEPLEIVQKSKTSRAKKVKKSSKS
jgi:hypothetical protein